MSLNRLGLPDSRLLDEMERSLPLIVRTAQQLSLTVAASPDKFSNGTKYGPGLP